MDREGERGTGVGGGGWQKGKSLVPKMIRELKGSVVIYQSDALNAHEGNKPDMHLILGDKVWTPMWDRSFGVR